MLSSPDSLRAVMRQWTTGVAVLTVAAGEQRRGMTVNSFTCVSLIPPKILVCVARGNRTHQLITQGGEFAISILGEDQAELGERFAGRSGFPDRLRGVEHECWLTGAPLLVGAIAALECNVSATHEAGTHTVIVADVVGARSIEERTPLVFNREYRRLQTGRQNRKTLSRI